jgi:phosphatidylserine/phosphatidylglycerophosphate/cardiolipin synthase-like enzyme
MKILAIILIFFSTFHPLVYVHSTNISNSVDQPKTKVFFNDNALQGIVELIDWTNDELLVQMYNFTGHETVEPIYQALERAADRGCDIKIYLDNQGSNNPDKQDGTGFPELRMEERGIQVKWEQSLKTMHRKVWISDSCTVFIGSSNISNNSFSRNDEIDIRLEDQTVVDSIKYQFTIDWEKANETFDGEEE